jgi:hypothetical protein
MDRVGAQPRVRAGIAAAREQGERPRGERACAESERFLHPAFEALRRLRPAAAAREQQLERGEARRAAAAEETRNDELAVHGYTVAAL